MQNALTRLREAWANTSQVNRIVLISVVLASVVAGAGFMFWASSPEYVTLISNPSPNDMQGILNFLRERKVDFRPTPDGRSIEVPASRRAELQMGLAAAGLMNSGSLGYDLLDKAPFGQSQVMEQTTIRRAQEGAMEQAIESLEPVASANVKFAPGEDSPFVSEKKEPSASVIVHLRPGQELTKSNIRAIVNLIARSYPGLNSRNIALVDGESNLLWDGSRQGVDTVGADERRAQERAYEEALAHDLKSQIRAAVGPNKFSVIVRAALNLDSQREERHEVTPGAPRAKETYTEKYARPTTAALPVPRQPVGMAANATGPATPPTYATPPPSNEENQNYTGERLVTTMDNTVVDTHTVKAPGEIKSLSVAVLLDKSVPPETLQAIKRTIETAVEADPTNPANNRRVSVETIAFDKTAQQQQEKQAAAAERAERINQLLSYGVPIGLMLLMLFILARSLRRTLPREMLAMSGAQRPALAAAGAAGGGLDVTVGEEVAPGMSVAEALEGSRSSGGISSVIPLSKGEKVHTFEVIEEAFDANLESILHLAKSKPETIAMLLKSWMAEDSK